MNSNGVSTAGTHPPRTATPADLVRTFLSPSLRAAGWLIGLFAAGIASSLSLIGILLQYFGEKFGRRSERLVNLPWNYIRSALILGIGLIYLVRLIKASAA